MYMYMYIYVPIPLESEMSHPLLGSSLTFCQY